MDEEINIECEHTPGEHRRAFALDMAVQSQDWADSEFGTASVISRAMAFEEYLKGAE